MAASPACWCNIGPLERAASSGKRRANKQSSSLRFLFHIYFIKLEICSPPPPPPPPLSCRPLCAWPKLASCRLAPMWPRRVICRYWRYHSRCPLLCVCGRESVCQLLLARTEAICSSWQPQQAENTRHTCPQNHTNRPRLEPGPLVGAVF